MALKRELAFVLLNVGKTSTDLRTWQQRTIEESIFKLKVIFMSKCRLNTLFQFKGLLKENKMLYNDLFLYL